MNKNIIIVIVAVVILGGGYLVFGSSKNSGTPTTTTESSSNTQAETSSETTKSTKNDADTIKEIIASYINDARAVKDIDDVVTLTTKYGTAAAVADMNAQKAQLESMPAAMKEMTISMFQNMPANSAITSSTINTSGSKSTATLASGNIKGTFVFELEGGSWKMVENEWTN